MEQYIKKSDVVTGIEKKKKLLPWGSCASQISMECNCKNEAYDDVISLLNTLEMKELAPIAYVVTRCEEHSDYVEEEFFNENKAQEYCEQFKGNENEYARHITKVKVTL